MVDHGGVQRREEAMVQVVHVCMIEIERKRDMEVCWLFAGHERNQEKTLKMMNSDNGRLLESNICSDGNEGPMVTTVVGEDAEWKEMIGGGLVREWWPVYVSSVLLYVRKYVFSSIAS